jgi:methylthioribose-1-phosphate isomerase
MKVGGVDRRTIRRDGPRVFIIDQARLPFELREVELDGVAQVAHAIRSMQVRGAPLIGATTAYGMALAMQSDPADAQLERTSALLGATRPTAVNLQWALARMIARLRPLAPAARANAAWQEADRIAEEDVALNRAIGRHGLALLQAIAETKGRVNVLTHCNAGWLATVDAGTALAPVYAAHDAGLDVHVWVDETRPRNQGLLTAWELSQHGVPNTLVADNAGGHLMQHGKVDIAIVGADRVSAGGDVCNKIGTYLKALAARDCGVPFYAAVPSPTIDWRIRDALREIPIEERDAAELLQVKGRDRQGNPVAVDLGIEGSGAANPAFDVTPAKLVTGLITDRGIVAATATGLATIRPMDEAAA